MKNASNHDLGRLDVPEPLRGIPNIPRVLKSPIRLDLAARSVLPLSATGSWTSAGGWNASLELLQMGNTPFYAEQLPTALEAGRRLSLAHPSATIPVRSDDVELYVTLFDSAHLTSGELRIEPAATGFNLRWSGVVDDFARGDSGRFLVALDGVAWDRVDLAAIAPADRAAAIARWFDDTEPFQLVGHLLVPQRKRPPAAARRPATVSLVFETVDGLAAAAAALDLALAAAGRPLQTPSDSATRDGAHVTATLWLRPLRRSRGVPDFGFSVDVADAAALEQRPDGAIAIRFGGDRPDAHSLKLVTLTDPGARITCASATVHLHLDQILHEHGGVRGAIRDAHGRVVWDWSRAT